jgi:hypothetical protein
VDVSEWATVANNLTLSGKALLYPPPPEPGAASVEERALAWLIDVEQDVAWRWASQHYAMVILALEWNNPEWTLAAAFDECGWAGITCDDNRTIIAMDLPSAELKGTIPADIALLTDLRTLDLYRNFLSGTAPWEPMLRYMTNMAALSLDDNGLSGPLPSPWPGTWLVLTTFWAEWNHFNGTISPSYAHCPSLDDFDVSANKLTGTLPSELGKISSFKSFVVFENKIGLTAHRDRRMDTAGQLSSRGQWVHGDYSH